MPGVAIGGIPYASLLVPVVAILAPCGPASHQAWWPPPKYAHAAFSKTPPQAMASGILSVQAWHVNKMKFCCDGETGDLCPEPPVLLFQLALFESRGGRFWQHPLPTKSSTPLERNNSAQLLPVRKAKGWQDAPGRLQSVLDERACRLQNPFGLSGLSSLLHSLIGLILLFILPIP